MVGVVYFGEWVVVDVFYVIEVYLLVGFGVD